MQHIAFVYQVRNITDTETVQLITNTLIITCSIVLTEILFMITSLNGSIFRITGPLWGESTLTGGFPSQRPMTGSFDILQWRHNERDGISIHRRLDRLLNCLFKYRSQKTTKLCVTGLCEGTPPMTGGFPSQEANDAENVSIWWRHHGMRIISSDLISFVVLWPRIIVVYILIFILMGRCFCGNAKIDLFSCQELKQ